MIKSNILGGANSNLAPLISFNTIVDTDIGLIKLVCEDFFDPAVFDEDLFKDLSKYQLIHKVYYRDHTNPLTAIAKKDTPIQLLDEYYQEFKEKYMSEIYKRSITTEMLNSIYNFNISQDINSVILCYSQEQIDLLNEESELEENKKILFSDIITKDKFSFKQYFFKYIDEIYPFDNCEAKTIYLSTFRPNFNETKEDLLDPKLVEKLIKNRNQISIFDLYRKDIIGGILES